MTIIDKIQESVEKATGLRFCYDTPQTLNERLDNIAMPCAMMQIVESGAVVDENGVIRERLNVLVLFVDESDLDFDGVENEAEKLEGMKKAAFRWLLELRQSETLRLVSIGNTQRYYATDDAVYTAFAVNCTIEDLEGVCYGGCKGCNC